MKRTDYGILIATIGLTAVLVAPAFGRTDGAIVCACIGAAVSLFSIRYI